MPTWPKPEETATLTVNGFDYKEWESVYVRHELGGEPPMLAIFTVSEGLPLAANLDKMQIAPGDHCTITLAGQLAFRGQVETRQVFYDAHRHHVQLQCATWTNIIEGSVIHKSMEWKDKTFSQIAEDVLRPAGIALKFEGGSPPTHKYPRASAIPGITIIDFLKDLASIIKTESGVGVRFKSNVNEDFVVVMGPNGGLDSVVEGKNIIIGREVIRRPSAASANPILSQGPGSDKKWGPEVTHKPFFSQAEKSIFLGNQLPRISWLPIASSEVEDLKGLNQNKSKIQASDEITVHAVTHGWLRPSDNNLWEANQQVQVISPMLMMHGDEKLTAKSVVFTQNNQTGTRTELELANDTARRGGTPQLR